MLRDSTPGDSDPETLGGTPVMLHLYDEDVDALAKTATDAGAKVLIPVADQFYGNRSGRLREPFGHIWVVSTHKEDLSPEEYKHHLNH